MIFQNKWMFLLALLIPLPFVIAYFRRGTASVTFSSLIDIKQLGTSWRHRLVWLPTLLRVAALCCLVLAIARPRQGISRTIESSEGIAIEVVIDRSSSMRAEMSFQGNPLNRLEVVKEVFRDFALGNKTTRDGRPNDLIGVISFARYADTISPLTLGHDAIPHFLKSIKLAAVRSEDGTAIGDALALAAARLRTAEETLKKQTDSKKVYTIKSKIIILLTDGEQTAGDRTALEGAELAKKWGIKVYTIGVGKAGYIVQNVFGRKQRVPVAGADTRTLKAIAQKTGGRFFNGEDEQALRDIYREIDRLETSEISSAKFVDYSERFQPLAWAALILIILDVLMRQLIFRRIP